MERKTTNFRGLTSLQRGGAFLRDFHLCNHHLKRRRIIPALALAFAQRRQPLLAKSVKSRQLSQRRRPMGLSECAASAKNSPIET